MARQQMQAHCADTPLFLYGVHTMLLLMCNWRLASCSCLVESIVWLQLAEHLLIIYRHLCADTLNRHIRLLAALARRCTVSCGPLKQHRRANKQQLATAHQQLTPQPLSNNSDSH